LHKFFVNVEVNKVFSACNYVMLLSRCTVDNIFTV